MEGHDEGGLGVPVLGFIGIAEGNKTVVDGIREYTEDKECGEFVSGYIQGGLEVIIQSIEADGGFITECIGNKKGLAGIGCLVGMVILAAEIMQYGYAA